MSWIDRAKVGDKVVCIDDGPSHLVGKTFYGLSVVHDLDGLSAGCVYTIMDMYIGKIEDTTIIVIEEINRGICPFDGREKGFAASRFRPVQSTEKGMQMLRDLLITQTVKENA